MKKIRLEPSNRFFLIQKLCNLLDSVTYIFVKFHAQPVYAPPAYIWISELGQPLQSYFGLYRKFTITMLFQPKTWTLETFLSFVLCLFFVILQIYIYKCYRYGNGLSNFVEIFCLYILDKSIKHLMQRILTRIFIRILLILYQNN